MIGKKASSHSKPQQSTSKIPQFFYPYLVRFLDLGLRLSFALSLQSSKYVALRGRQSYPEIGKREDLHNQAVMGLSKRGFPRFSVPDHWKKKTSSLSKVGFIIEDLPIRY